MDKKDPYEYICMKRPQHDWETENNTAEEAMDEEELEEKIEAEEAEYKHDQPASERPDHKWIIMRKGWMKLCDASQQGTFRCPDMFNMYVYNDFEGYGQLEVIENAIAAYIDEFKKKDRNLKDMWVRIVALGHWMNIAGLEPLYMIDDGERFEKMLELVARALLSMLNALDHAGQLSSSSEFKDVGIVIGLYNQIAETFADNYPHELNESALMYAVEKGIDVSTVYGTTEKLESIESDTPSWPKAAEDRWGFVKKVNAYKKSYGKLGGSEYDITKWSRAQRAKQADDGKDPLASIPEKEIKAGNIMVS